MAKRTVTVEQDARALIECTHKVTVGMMCTDCGSTHDGKSWRSPRLLNQLALAVDRLDGIRRALDNT